MPGETYQTLKSKATQQAKQSGMSQSAAENYGSAMATQSAVQGGANTTGDFLGANEKQINDTVQEIISNVGVQGGTPNFTDTASQAATQNVLGQTAAREAAEKKMQDAGGVFNPQTGMVEYPQKTKLGLGNFSLENIPSLTLQAGIGGAKALQALLDKVFKPQISDFSNPNFLAVLNAAFKSGRLDKDDYTEKYKDLLDNVYSGQAKENLEAGLGSLDSEGLFDLAMEEATANVEPGSGTQRITDPKGFYLDDGQGILPQTSGALVDLANIAVTPEMQGANPELVKMIFDARAELNRMGKNPMTGESQGQGGQGITSIPSGISTDFTTPNMDITKPGYTGDPNNPFGLPGDYGAGFMQSQFYKPSQPGLAVMTPVKLPDGTTHMFPDSSSANQFQQYLDNLAMNKMGPYAGPYQSVTTSTGVPAAFNYASMAPQFTGSQYTNQGVSPMLGDYYGNLRRFYG